MNFEPTAEQLALVQAVRKFVREEIVPLETDLPPDAGVLPKDVADRLKIKVDQMGLAAWDAPAADGGPGLDVVTRTLLAIEMSQHRAGLYASCYGVFGGSGLAHLYEANADQKERYLYPTLRGERHGFFALSEASGGSDPARSIRTRAVRDGDDWVINGTKMWISNVTESDYGIVVARTGTGRKGLTCFIVDTDTPGFKLLRVIPSLRKVHEPTELAFDDMRVPDANRLGEVGEGFTLAAGRLANFRIPYSASCVGVAIAAHRLAVEYAQIRETFGKPLAQQQGIQWMLVENEIDIRAARLLVLDAASRADRGADVKSAASIAKIYCTEAAARVVDRSMQIHGGLGVAADMPFERWFREMRIRRIGEGPNEVQRVVVARDILGQAATVSGVTK